MRTDWADPKEDKEDGSPLFPEAMVGFV